jgi:flagellar biosynthesis protein FliQ
MTGLSVEALLAVGREAVLAVLIASAPPLGAALCVGLLVGVVQAATQVQEASLGVVPRLAAVFLALGLGGPWIGAYLVRFAAKCLDLALRVSP